MKLFPSEWQIAYRKRSCGSVITDNKTPFTLLRNKGNAAADPFLFTRDGKEYLFAELMINKAVPGKIAYCEWNGNSFGSWNVVIDEPYHLSYPNIFECGGNLFLVAETSEIGSVYAYKAVHFPTKWEKCKPILSGKKFVDTTFLSISNDYYMFSYDIQQSDRKKLWRYKVDIGGSGSFELSHPLLISTDDSSARPGGNFFKYDDKLLRVSQDCGKDYGVAIVFSEIVQCDDNGYEEKQFLKIQPSELKYNGIHRFTGIHTYNADNDFEVIDLHVKNYGVMTLLKRIIAKVSK